MDRQDAAEEDAWIVQQKQRVIQEKIEHFRLLAENTKNPLYVWQAIAFISLLKEPLPPWCFEYVKSCAFRIYDLIVAVVGYDQNSHIDASIKHAHAQIAPKKAMEKVSNALGLNKKSYNAFKDLTKDSKLKEDAAFIKLMAFSRIDGQSIPSERAALEKIKTRRNANEIRSAKERVKKGNRLLNPDKTR